MTGALSFSNDIDFADWASYQDVHHTLREEYGIDAEDSFWLFDPAGGDMALFKSSLQEKGPRHDELLADIAAGRLTTLHSAGAFDRATTDVHATRELVADGLAYLAEQVGVPRIWTNHGDEGNVQNIGFPTAVYQQGDVPQSDVFLVDLLLQYGVRYFWTDVLTTNDFAGGRKGQNVPPVVVDQATRAGFNIQGFIRYRGALPKAPDAQSLGRQLTEEHLDELVERRAATVVYQHWCVHRDGAGRPFTARPPIFPDESQRALAELARRRDAGKLRILRVEQLLDECVGLTIGACA